MGGNSSKIVVQPEADEIINRYTDKRIANKKVLSNFVKQHSAKLTEQCEQVKKRHSDLFDAKKLHEKNEQEELQNKDDYASILKLKHFDLMFDVNNKEPFDEYIIHDKVYQAEIREACNDHLKHVEAYLLAYNMLQYDLYDDMIQELHAIDQAYSIKDWKSHIPASQWVVVESPVGSLE